MCPLVPQPLAGGYHLLIGLLVQDFGMVRWMLLVPQSCGMLGLGNNATVIAKSGWVCGLGVMPSTGQTVTGEQEALS